MKTSLFTLVGLLTALLMPAQDAAATTHIVTFICCEYTPSSFPAAVGDTVTWQGTFSDHPLESTTIPAGASSFNNNTGTSFSYVIQVAGTYNYQCEFHQPAMAGSFTAAGGGTVKTINNTLPTGGDNYASFTDAITALNTGGVPAGGITFNVSAGQTFTENPPEIIATGTTSDQILFQKSGAGTNPKIVPATPGTVASTTTLGSNGDGIVVINGGDYITFDGIDLQTDPTFTGAGMMEYGYYFKKVSGTDACKNVTIKNCSITLNKTAIYSFGVFVSNISGTATVTVTSTGGRSENIKLHNLTIANSYGGIQLRGYASATPFDFYDQNIDVGVNGPNSITNYGGAGTTAYGIYAIYQNNLKLANNTVNSGSGSTAIVYGIFTSTGTNSNLDIYGNTVTVTGGGTTSTVYGINNAMGSTGTSNVVNMYDNTVTGCTYPTATTGVMYLLYSTATPSKLNLYGNTVSGNSSAGTGSMYCVYGSGAVVDSVRMYNNTVMNNTRLATGSMYCLYNSPASTANSEVYDNFVHGNTSAGGSVYGIYGDAGAINNIYRNRVYDQSTTAGTSPVLYGIYTSTAATVRIFNNFISDLRALASTSSVAVTGIYISSGTNIGAYYNTIYLNATSTSATTFGTTGIYASTTPTVDLRNNVIVNLSEPGPTGGGVVAYRRSSATLTSYASESNNNDFFVDPGAGVRRYFYGEGTGASVANADSTLADYKARVAPRDANTIRENPPFINVATTPYDLHINTTTPTGLESGGTPVTTPIAITQDYDGNTRSVTTPDIGADEFSGIAGDITPPAISYSPVGNTSAGTAQTLLATIIDASGVPTAGIGRPVTYWKRNSGGAYTAATGTFVSGHDFSFSFGSGTVVGDTVYYFVAAQDSALNVGVFPSTGASGLTPNPPAASTPPTDPSSYLVLPTLAGGTYTVGTASGTYQTLKAAFDEANGSVITGNITLSILPQGTTESTPAILNELAYAAGGPYTITIKPASGASPTIMGDFPELVVKFNGADNVTVDGSNTSGGTTRDLTIASASQSNNSGVLWLASQGTNMGSEHVIIKNCNLVGGRADTNNTFGVFAAGTAITSAGTGAHNNNLVVENNAFTRLRFAVYSRGVASTGIQNGLIIRNNVMGSDSAGLEVNYRAIDIGNTDSALVTDNQIFNMVQPQNITVTGIHMDVGVTNAMIAKNRIYKIHQTNTGTFGAQGINVNSTTTNNITIANNMIADLICDGGGTSTVSNPFGIRIAGGTNHKVYYNSVSLTGSFFNATTTDLSAAFIVTVATATGLDMRNNIFSNTMTGGGTTTCYGIYAVSASTVFGTINNNDYYVAGPNGILGRQGTTAVPDLAGWRTFTGQDANSISGDPVFLNPATNLHINTTAISPVDGAGAPIAGITTDIDGQTRNTTTPDIGADEYTIVAQISKLLITEFVVTPTGGEFIEIYNPTASTVNLSNYYLTDATFSGDGSYYYNIVRDTLFGGGAFGDFHSRFPSGSTIAPGQYQTVALNGNVDFFAAYGVNPTYEIDQSEFASGTPDSIPNMLEVKRGSIYGADSTHNPGLTNGDEVIILYYWNGLSDLVGDVDYVLYNAGSPVPNDEAVDKTGILIDGPDPDTLRSAYLPDIAVGSQMSAPNHSASGRSVHRINFSEGAQISSGGNGVTGANEMSEDLNNTFTNNSVPTPNAPYQPAVSVATISDGIPKTFDLAQNYPNPFNPSTTIRFDLPTESNVTLKIYNLLGQEVAALVQGVHPPGFLSTEWNGKNPSGSQVASGVYFYRIDAKPINGDAPFTSLKKMLLLK